MSPLGPDTEHDRRESAEERASLYAEESGAIMLIGVFMAIFLVGMLYWVVGIAEVTVYRQHLQDAADAASFASAVTQAKGMNLIVLANFVMAILMGLLILLYVANDVLTLSYLIATMAIGPPVFCCWSPNPLWVPAMTAIESAREVVLAAIESYEPFVMEANQIIHLATEGVIYGYPAIAQARSYETIGDASFSSVTSSGFPLPIYAQLPVEDDDTREMCDRGIEYCADLAGRVLSWIPLVGSAAASLFRRLYKGLARGHASHLCGERSGVPPGSNVRDDAADPYTVSYDEILPEIPELRACSNRCQNGRLHIPMSRRWVHGEEAPPPDNTMPIPECDPCRDLDSMDDAAQRRCDAAVADLCETGYEELSRRMPYDCTHRPSDPNYCADISNWDHDGGCDSMPGGIAAENYCHAKAREAASTCASTEGARTFLATTESRYVSYYADTDPVTGVCTVRAAYPNRENLAPVLLNQRDGSSPSLPAGCTDDSGPVGGRVGSPDTPWDAACGYEVPTGGMPANCASAPYASLEALFSDAARGGNPGRFAANSQEVTIVYEIYGCEVSVTERWDDAMEPPTEMDVSDLPAANCNEFSCPRRVCVHQSSGGSFLSGGCESGGEVLLLGDSDFQQRFAVQGVSAPDVGERGIEVASFGARDGTINAISSVVRTMGRYTIAQSEFFWDQDENHAGGLNRGRIEWMWEMAWRARLRRVFFRDASDANAACSSGPCGGVAGFADALNEVFVH